MPEDLHQRQQGRQAHLVVFGTDAFFQVVKTGGPPAIFHYGPRYRNLDTQELIAITILSRTGFEEPGQPLHLGRVGTSQHP